MSFTIIIREDQEHKTNKNKRPVTSRIMGKKAILLDLGTLLEYDPSSPSQPKELSWRCDPEESFSDWTIIVNQKAGVACEAEEVEPAPPATYHVNKIFLGAGPRSSEYFRSLFRNTELAESKTSTTVLELEASAARAFPDMLDFIYNQKENLSSESAVPLRHLASYFCVPTLFEHTNKFIQKDIGTSNIHVYLKEALLYQDDTMIWATMKVAANNWRFLAPNSNTSASEPARYLALLPQEKQLEVMQLALQRAALSKLVSSKPGDVDLQAGFGTLRVQVTFDLLKQTDKVVLKGQKDRLRLYIDDDEE
jgi:hypothetical protein